MKFTHSDLLLKITQLGLKLFLLLLPWQTVYIVQASVLPMESVIIHGTALLLFCVLILGLLQYKPKINHWILVSAIFVIFFQMWNAEDSLLAFQQVIWLLLGLGFLWLLSTNLLKKSEQINYLTIGAIIPACLGLYQFFAQTSFISKWLGLSFIPSSLSGSPIIVSESGRWLRAFGTFPHPNIFGGYLVGILGLLFARANEYSISHKINWIWRLAVALFTTILILTFSRSALAVWVLFMIFFHYKIFKFARGSELAIQVFISMLTAALVLTATWSIWSGRLGQGITSQNEIVSINERLSGNQTAKKIIKNNWVTGVGPGNYTEALHRAAPDLKSWEVVPVHNVPLLILAEWGVFGIGLIGLLKYYLKTKTLFLLPILLLDHYLYSLWPGIIVGIILILSTVYAHRGLTQPK